MVGTDNSVPFRSPAFLSVVQRTPIYGKPDYFIFAKGRYVQEIDGGVRQMVIGDYAVSFGETCRKVAEILGSYQRNFFQIETISFSRRSEDRKKCESIKSLVNRHNLRRTLKIVSNNIEKRI